MLRFFKKKVVNHIQDWEYDLLKSIAVKLPSDYSFLIKQISRDFIFDSVPNELLKNGWKRIICDENLYNSFRKKDLNFILQGIKVFDLETKGYKNVELDLYEGVLIGYKIDSSNGVFDLDKIDIKNLREKYFDNKDKEELERIIGEINKDLLKQLDIDDTFIINLPEGQFYMIKDFGDGNYLAMLNNGAVFGMIHDPYEIEKLFDNKDQFLNELESGEFDPISYYEKKMS